MRRAVFIILLGFSFGITLGVVCVWVLSYQYHNVIIVGWFETPVAIESAHGRWWVTHNDPRVPWVYPTRSFLFYSEDATAEHARHIENLGTWTRWDLVGITFGRFRNSSGWMTYAMMPFWFTVLTLLALFGLLLWLTRTARRYRKGYCLECGYDLRASKDRCPECGALIPAAAPLSPEYAPRGARGTRG